LCLQMCEHCLAMQCRARCCCAPSAMLFARVVPDRGFPVAQFAAAATLHWRCIQELLCGAVVGCGFCAQLHAMPCSACQLLRHGCAHTQSLKDLRIQPLIGFCWLCLSVLRGHMQVQLVSATMCMSHTQKPQHTNHHRSQSLVTMVGASITSGSTTRQVLLATLHHGTLPVKTHNSGSTCDQLLQRQLSE
jgi:hypothetical protein